MKLRDMVRKKRRPEPAPIEVPFDEEKYPYGLQVRLETEDIEKLGINVKSFSIDDNVKIEAVAFVENLSQNKTRRGENKHMCLQITKMNVSKKKTLKDLK